MAMRTISETGRRSRSEPKKEIFCKHANAKERMGGEAVSLRLNYSQSLLFGATPYVDLTVDGAQRGVVREFGNLSFALVFDAGHLIPTYKPDVALEIFRRAIDDRDVATGLHAVGSDETVPFPPDTPIRRGRTRRTRAREG